MGGNRHVANRPLLDPAFLAKLEKLTLEWRDRFTGPGGGSKTSRHRGAGQEFFEHRHFRSGDDFRTVDWRAYMRFETLFLKTFQLEPRVPMRLLLDVSASMNTDGADEPAKFDYARRLAAALTYIALIQLDSILLQPFSDRLHRPEIASGGRQHFASAERYLRELRASGRTDFLPVAREFLQRYPRRGLVMIISDFFEDSGTLSPLQEIAASGHELMLVQLWSEEDRQPSGEGDLELTDAESGMTVTLALDEAARQAYTNAFDRHAGQVRELATHHDGRYTAVSTGMPVEEVIFGPLALGRKP
ncbi:MAG: DUF58 domain-containing protein [Bryobacteraceae bacterium]